MPEPTDAVPAASRTTARTTARTQARIPVETVLAPATRLLWRSGRAVQLEADGRRAIVDGVGSATVRRLMGRPPADTDPPDPGVTQLPTVTGRLIREGFVWPAGSPGIEDPRQVPPVPRLAPEVTALSGRAGERAAELVAARRQCAVTVLGRGRAGPHIAAVLAAAGVGRVHVADTGPVRLHHAVPGGVQPDQEGVPLAQAAAAVAVRGAPDVDVVPPPYGDPPDLVVLATDHPVDPERIDALHARGCAHLLVELSGGHAVVGPLVLPGLTSCLRCCDLHRTDRDPAWNAIAAQLSLTHRAAMTSEVSLATVVAGLAAGQALGFFDGDRPATVEGSLEVHLPDWRIRRRTWPVHPDCRCMPAGSPSG